MAILNLQGVNILEGDSSLKYATFTVTLDLPAFTGTQFYYYLQDVSASQRQGDFQGQAVLVTIPAGQTSYSIDVPVYGDTQVEGNESFQLVLFAAPGTTLAGNAAALIATATIFDNDDAIPDPAPGPGEMATQIFGPSPASATLPRSACATSA